MDDELAKSGLHDELRWIRAAVLAKLDGLSEHDVRRPLTTTGTNLLGLVKHLTESEVRYLGDVFDRPPPWALPAWDDDAAWSLDSMWAAADETRADIVERYRQACAHADATIAALPLDAPGLVPWWRRPEVTLLSAMLHVLTETARHAGHADILREQLDGAVGAGPVSTVLHGRDATYWAAHRARVEEAASSWLDGDVSDG